MRGGGLQLVRLAAGEAPELLDRELQLVVLVDPGRLRVEHARTDALQVGLGAVAVLLFWEISVAISFRAARLSSASASSSRFSCTRT